jgi:hypothetical protein
LNLFEAEGIGDDGEPPAANSARLIVREIDSETLVYDHARDAATCLNVLPPKVWPQCDGETSVAGIAVSARRGQTRRRDRRADGGPRQPSIAPLPVLS